MTAVPTEQHSLDEWLAYLESIHSTSIDMGLDRINEVAKRLDVDWSGVKIIVGGTNGKGSTCAML